MIVVTGANGQLGQEILRAKWQEAVGALTRSQLDIRDRSAVSSLLGSLQPRVVINCAAYTAVDAAEDDASTCHEINSLGVKNLAEATADLGATLVHISTDYVFGGAVDQEHPRPEYFPLSPRGVYATSKRAGEVHAATCPSHLIIRTCGLYGFRPRGRNFVETMLRLASERDELRVVDDQVCNPTSTKTVVDALKQLLNMEQQGIFHIVNSPAMSWFDFAAEIFRQADLDVTLKPIRSEEFAAKAPRPAYSALDTTRYEKTVGRRLPSIPDALCEYLWERQQVLSRVSGDCQDIISENHV